MNLINQPIVITIEELCDTIMLNNSSVWKKNIHTKFNISSNYHDLSISDRETLLKMMHNWTEDELDKVTNIVNNTLNKQ